MSAAVFCTPVRSMTTEGVRDAITTLERWTPRTVLSSAYRTRALAAARAELASRA